MNARTLGHLVAQREKQADSEDLAAGASAAGGGYAASQLGRAAWANRKYRVPSMLDASQELWNGPVGPRLGRYISSWDTYHRIRDLAKNSPLRFKALMSGAMSDPEISARELASIRNLTFNTPYEAAKSRLGDVILHLSSENYKNPSNRIGLAIQQAAGGGSMAHADFDTGGVIPGLKATKNEPVIGLWPGDSGFGGEYQTFHPAVSGADTANATAIRLRPKMKITPEVVEHATPGIQAIFGKEAPQFNTALMGRITANEVAGESAGPVSRALGSVGTFLQKHKLTGRLRQLGLQDVYKQVLLPQMRSGAGDVCSSSAAKALHAVNPEIMSAERAAVAAPSEFMRMARGSEKSMDVLGMNLARQARKPGALIGEHLLSYAPTALRGIPAAIAAGVGAWGAKDLIQRHGPQLVNAAGQAAHGVADVAGQAAHGLASTIAPGLTADWSALKSLKG